MTIFFPALFCIFFASVSFAEDSVSTSPQPLPETFGCENPYLENEVQLKAYVEECLGEFEARQKCSRPFIFWNKSKTIITHWIPFSKGVTIGRNCFSTFNKAEIKALLASSFQKYGPFKIALITLVPAVVVASLIVLGSSFVAFSIWLVLAACLNLPYNIWAMQADLFVAPATFAIASIVLYFFARAYLETIFSSPLCSSDKMSVELYGNESVLLSALKIAKEQEVVSGQSLSFSPRRLFSCRAKLANAWNFYGSRISNLQKNIQKKQKLSNRGFRKIKPIKIQLPKCEMHMFTEQGLVV